MRMNTATNYGRWRTLCGAFCYIGLTLSGSISAQTFFTETTAQIASPLMPARSTSFGDYDNDGWPDLFLAQGLGARIALVRNEGNGRFTDRTTDIVSAVSPKSKGGGAVFGDYDNDGDLDLYVPVGSFRAEEADLDMLLRNDRGVLTNVARQAGLTDSLSSDNAIWLDYDRDGHLDLYVGHRRSPPVENTLYRNNGDGTFANVTAAAGLDVALSVEFGSNGGMVAGDFNDDGWPDLYMGVYEAPNRLFVNDQLGEFQDVTTDEIGDVGLAFGLAVGDIDNDGHLDLFQASGQDERFRSSMFLNLGEAQLIDVTEGVGLIAAAGGNTISTAGLADIDNDGDLDLLLGGRTSFLFLNNGDGTFVDQTMQSGLEDISLTVSFADYNLDGFLDVVSGSKSGTGEFGGLYLNNGNDNHYLRVELVGVQSNRSGIGTRLIASAGQLRQTRELLGGVGYYQDELVAHFGLGQRTVVQRLEIRWPSGQVDVLSDIAADQKIRVFEGRQGYHPVRPRRWENLPDIVTAGAQLELSATLHPALFEADAEVTRISADLSALGGPDEVVLVPKGDGGYLLETAFAVDGVNALKTISLSIDQQTSLGPYWTKATEHIAVYPAADLTILDEAAAGEWQMGLVGPVQAPTFTAAGPVYQGDLAAAFQVEQETRLWRINLSPGEPVSPFGFTLRFALHPGDVGEGAGRTLMLIANDKNRLPLNLVLPDREENRVDLERRAWQEIEIPLEALSLDEPIEEIRFRGDLEGTFYLDDIRLVAATSPPITAVLEEHTSSLPTSFILSQNYPNPFNSGTVIRFALPQSQEVELAVFNLAGQKVATLLQGTRPAGSYTVNWDGRDNNERALASGMYLYRLQAGLQQQTHKLLLLR